MLLAYCSSCLEKSFTPLDTRLPHSCTSVSEPGPEPASAPQTQSGTGRGVLDLPEGPLPSSGPKPGMGVGQEPRGPEQWCSWDPTPRGAVAPGPLGVTRGGSSQEPVAGLGF